jgi:hypothetical protein
LEFWARRVEAPVGVCRSKNGLIGQMKNGP